MIYLVMFLKSVGWLFAFWSGIRCRLRGMLLWAIGITVFLTLADVLSDTGHLELPGILLTLLLYMVMSFFLLALSWKVRSPAVSMACNVMGTMGAFAVVSMTVNFVLLPV